MERKKERKKERIIDYRVEELKKGNKRKRKKEDRRKRN